MSVREVFERSDRSRDTGGSADEPTTLEELRQKMDRHFMPGLRLRMSGSGWVLIRPDQVITARGTGADVETLRHYVDRVIRPPGAPW